MAKLRQVRELMDIATLEHQAARRHYTQYRMWMKKLEKVKWLQEMIGRQGGGCTWCGEPYTADTDPATLAVDHIIPKKKGGGDGPDNLQVLHAACNGEKGTRPMSEAPARRRML